MASFGKKLRECRENKNLSQSEVAKLLGTNHSIIGKYERDEVKPTIDVVKKLANILDTTVGYLLGETEESDLFKDKKMLQRLQDITRLPEQERNSILLTLDHFIKASKINLI
jgi:transcriptional regulator with XRE-family HTH domain